MSESDQFYQQIADSIKLVFDLTSRVDERVKFLIQQHNADYEKMEKLADKVEENSVKLFFLEKKIANGMTSDLNEMQEDIQDMKIKISNLEIHTDLNQGKWRNISGFFFQVAITIIGAALTIITGILLWKLGINP